MAQHAEQNDIAWHVVGDDVVESICDVASPQGLVARCATVVPGVDALPKNAGLVGVRGR